MNWLQKLLGRPDAKSEGMRSVQGAMVVRTGDNEVVYNMLTPHMQQFMGRCINAIKKSGLRAKGTGQFSILVGDAQHEVRLEEFYHASDDLGIVDQVVQEARKMQK